MFDVLTCFLFLEFLTPCRTRFSSEATFIQPTELLFPFHVVPVCWRQILSAFVSLKMYFTFEGLYTGYRIWSWQGFFFSFST